MLVHKDDPVGALESGGDGADMGAGRVLAMKTHGRHLAFPRPGDAFLFKGYFPYPVNIQLRIVEVGHVVLFSACADACVATFAAFIDIDNHPPFVFGRRPVASPFYRRFRLVTVILIMPMATGCMGERRADGAQGRTCGDQAANRQQIPSVKSHIEPFLQIVMMTVPAFRLHSHIVMAPVAELLSFRVAVDATMKAVIDHPHAFTDGFFADMD